MTKYIIDFCANLISTLGYPGIFILMFCESMYFPVPSFAVMPFVGFAAHQVVLGERAQGPDFWLGLLVGVAGGLAGSLSTYYFGKWAGPVGVRKWGRYAGLVPEDLELTQKWFEKRGIVTVFIARFIPVVRHFISTAAGLARMNIAAFVAMSTSGMFIWDFILTYAGWELKAAYATIISKYMKPVDALVIVCFGGGGLYLLKKLRARIKAAKARSASPPAGAPPAGAAVAPSADAAGPAAPTASPAESPAASRTDPSPGA